MGAAGTPERGSRRIISGTLPCPAPATLPAPQLEALQTRRGTGLRTDFGTWDLGFWIWDLTV